jgi:hypothetical protein
MLTDGSLTVGSVKTRILISKLEAQLRFDVLPDGDERETMREKIQMCDLVLASLDGRPTSFGSDAQDLRHSNPVWG